MSPLLTYLNFYAVEPKTHSLNAYETINLYVIITLYDLFSEGWD